MNIDEIKPSRRAILGVFAGLCTVAAAPVYARAPGLMRKAGKTRSISMYSQRTGESIKTIYHVDGKYIPEAMSEISYFMRDWRQNEVRAYDPNNIDNLAATLALMETSEPYLMISGYRTPRTNRMLRGAASNSYHMRAMAADIRLKSRDVRTIQRAALRCNGGGVGYYRRSNFVHIDCGPVRTWNG
ncbi:YcbK family protein [Amaricoccus sp. W119]|uniref:YcbK family protein n=1 Tax=Amaricoccus sp. W119 TaxID=3391833 RepID=UPI0039A73B8E